MAFITRLSRLMRADLHALLDRLEAPDLVLAQAVREMEQALDRERRDLAQAEREHQRLRDRDLELTRVLDQTCQALEDCLDVDQEDLARSMARRRLETEQQMRGLRQRLQMRDSELTSRRGRIADQEARLTDLRARAALYDAEPASDSEECDCWGGSTQGVRDADVEVALLQAKRRREGMS